MPTIRDDAVIGASETTVERAERQYEAVDGMDMDRFISFLAEDA
jgi:hypothetical protein